MYVISTLLLVVVVMAVSVKSELELLKKFSACGKMTTWSKERMEESCKNEIPDDAAELKNFLALNTCLWETAGVEPPQQTEVDSTGNVYPDKAKNLVKPEEASAAVDLVKACTPKEQKSNAEEAALAVNECYRHIAPEKFVRDCLTLIQVTQ